ncbi:sialin-like [Clytia hemisphaerica]|uniref:Sialin n=1 Tax=Clytia hemisphaerica TaxID=252671 RepID=A0A7M5X453_9CNID
MSFEMDRVEKGKEVKGENSDLYSYDASSNHKANHDRPKADLCCCACLPKRYLVAIMAFFGFVNVYALRVNLSVAMVAMVSNRTAKYANGTEYTVSPELDWSPKLQGFVLSSFFYGYIITQIPGGWLATKYGGKNLFGCGVLMTALFTLITPPAARCNVYLLVAVRMAEGLFEGVTFPSIYAIWRKWAPPLERSKLATISFSGPFAGTVLGMPLSGVIANSFGWPWVFYTFGLFGVIWSFFWFALVTDSPCDHPKISKEELDYIQNSLKQDKPEKQVENIPWKDFITSLPVWAIIIAHMTENWGWYTLLTQLPTYLKSVLDFNLQAAGFLAALPYLAMVIVVQCAGRLADFLRSRNMMSTTAVRKMFNSIGFFSQALFMVIVGYTKNKDLAIIGLTLAVGLGGFAWTGFPINHLDIAPRYASILFGISNCFATLPGIISPLVVGLITPHETQEEWRVVFFIAASIYLFGLLFYCIFASGEKQEWADGNQYFNHTNDDGEEGHELLANKSGVDEEDE